VALILKFVSGEERRYEADTATLDDYDRLFVLKKWNSKKRRLESDKVFDAGEIVMALLDNGDIVLGKGKSK
jgi:hypothetical protein